jgi:hypothetical protein
VLHRKSGPPAGASHEARISSFYPHPQPVVQHRRRYGLRAIDCADQRHNSRRNGCRGSHGKRHHDNEQTGIRWEAKTNQAGIYTIPLLQPGAYRINVQADGFRTVTRSGVVLKVAQTATLDFSLELGATSESITVSDTTPLLDSGSNAIGAVVDPEKVEDLPMLGRNSNALVTLVPGVRATRQTTLNAVLESHYQFFSINGSRPNQSLFMLDGVNYTNLTFFGPDYI